MDKTNIGKTNHKILILFAYLIVPFCEFIYEIRFIPTLVQDFLNKFLLFNHQHVYRVEKMEK